MLPGDPAPSAFTSLAVGESVLHFFVGTQRHPENADDLRD
jgi:hypothetical protein